MKVAIIGAGPAGLVAAREALHHGCNVTVFESQPAPGGVWIYSEEVENDALGNSPSRRLHASLYESLTTNLPRDLMAFLDYPFDSSGGGDDNWPRFPHHTCVQRYLENFAADFDLTRHIRFNTVVDQVKTLGAGWQVQAAGEMLTFDAVIVCNGHYAEPRIPALPGIECFTGHIMHSHNYRRPDAMQGERVAVWGSSASGMDISQEIAAVADHVYWCGNVFTGETPTGPNRTGLPSPTHIDTEGKLHAGDAVLDVDRLLFCTGYHYRFPFLEDGIIRVEDNYVSPLYQQVVPPDQPTIGFIGLPMLVVPFPVFEIQARWFVRQLVGDFSLPDNMHDAIARFETAREKEQVRKRHYHRLGDRQFAYYNSLALECGADPLPAWFRETWLDLGRAREKDMLNYKRVEIPVRGPTVCNDV